MGLGVKVKGLARWGGSTTSTSLSLEGVEGCWGSPVADPVVVGPVVAFSFFVVAACSFRVRPLRGDGGIGWGSGLDSEPIAR